MDVQDDLELHCSHMTCFTQYAKSKATKQKSNCQDHTNNASPKRRILISIEYKYNNNDEGFNFKLLPCWVIIIADSVAPDQSAHLI